MLEASRTESEADAFAPTALPRNPRSSFRYPTRGAGFPSEKLAVGVRAVLHDQAGRHWTRPRDRAHDRRDLWREDMGRQQARRRSGVSVRPAARAPPREFHYGRTLTARAATTTSVNSEIVLSSIISILARRVSGAASVGLNAVAVLYQETGSRGTSVASPTRRRRARCLRKKPIRLRAHPASPGVRPSPIDLPIDQGEGQDIGDPDRKRRREERYLARFRWVKRDDADHVRQFRSRVDDIRKGEQLR